MATVFFLPHRFGMLMMLTVTTKKTATTTNQTKKKTRQLQLLIDTPTTKI
jgi:hypothetical protein